MWYKIKWGIEELIKCFSNKDSFFSLKRINTEIAFLSAIGVDLFYVHSHRNILTSAEALTHVLALFAAGGYHLNKIQEEKKENNATKD